MSGRGEWRWMASSRLRYETIIHVWFSVSIIMAVLQYRDCLTCRFIRVHLLILALLLGREEEAYHIGV